MPAPARFERMAFWSALLFALVIFFGPLIWIWKYQGTFGAEELSRGGEATVGIAVILRATMRRTIGTYTRTMGRAVTRRIVKFAIRIIGGNITRQAADQLADESRESFGGNVLALVLGALVLGLSFWGVLAVAGDEGALQFTTAKGLTLAGAAGLAAIPLLVYAAANLLAGRFFGVEVRMRSELDGLLLQGYFTGAGSFLPMTTDFEYKGTDRAQAFVAATAIGCLLVTHFLLAWLGTQSPAMSFLATMFLVYVFVYSFPIKPLEGYDIWKQSKLLWAAIWAPILWAFIQRLPEEFQTIL